MAAAGRRYGVSCLLFVRDERVVPPKFGQVQALAAAGASARSDRETRAPPPRSDAPRRRVRKYAKMKHGASTLGGGGGEGGVRGGGEGDAPKQRKKVRRGNKVKNSKKEREKDEVAASAQHDAAGVGGGDGGEAKKKRKKKRQLEEGQGHDPDQGAEQGHGQGHGEGNDASLSGGSSKKSKKKKLKKSEAGADGATSGGSGTLVAAAGASGGGSGQRPVPPHRLILAPMVGGSELAFRLLCRKYGADLCYTPMMNSEKFVSDPEYRAKEFTTTTDGSDRPLVAHFSCNKPAVFLEAAKVCW